jgi:hypothetical protein
METLVTITLKIPLKPMGRNSGHNDPENTVKPMEKLIKSTLIISSNTLETTNMKINTNYWPSLTSCSSLESVAISIKHV